MAVLVALAPTDIERLMDAVRDYRVGSFVPGFVALVVAAPLNLGLTLTGIGGLVAFAIAAAGFGAVVCDWLA